MQNIVSIFDMHSTEGHPLPKTAALFKDALFMESSPETNSNRAVGQFLPGGVGGANATSGFMAKSALNPVDFILMLEGCLCFSASANRILSSKKMPQAAAPFAVRSRAVGYGSGALSDETARGEQWMPLWGTPLTYQAFKQFLGEGRSMCGSKNAERSFDFARSIARLGVARGITEFQRFGYIERNGQANLATPLGRWRVQPQPYQDLLDEIAPWINRLRRASNGKNAPACLSRACWNCDEAVMNCCRDGKTKHRWLNLLVALGEAEASLVGSPKIATDPQKSLRPLPLMSRQWIQAADTGTPEFRLALAFASQGTLNDQKKSDWGGTIRRHLVPLDKTLRKFAPLSDSRAWKNELVVKTDFERAAREIMQRRLLWKKSSESFPLGPLGHVGIQLADLQAFFDHTIDDNLIMSLIRPFMAIRKPSEIQWQFKDSSGVRAGDLSIFALLKLCHLPWAIPLGESEITVRTDPGIIARLEAGDLPQAVAIALRRLRASGLRPHIVTALGSPGQSRRLAAALAFPITPQQAKMFAMSLTKPTIELSRELLEQKD
jgi:CRISPR-associated protein Csx17